MIKTHLKNRDEEVLAIVVRHYVDTAEPVGSRYVARKLGLSSATIRNVMADLEDAGLICQPHTSAGRIPTDKGYRYYIDSLMRIKRINESIARMVRVEYQRAMRSFEEVLEKTAHLISSLTRHIGISLFPQSERVYLDGASHIIEQPEFKDLEKLYTIFRCLEEKSALLDLLSGDTDECDRITIHIGRENNSAYLNECSIVTRGYKVRGQPAGRVGVIGPKRMLYEKVIPTVELLADTVTDVLEEVEF